MIFRNPQGAPELACNECGCRWYDRQTNSCYECGTAVPQDEISEYLRVLRDFHAARGIVVNPPEARLAGLPSFQLRRGLGGC